jgi:hypothetical protein
VHQPADDVVEIVVLHFERLQPLLKLRLLFFAQREVSHAV